MKMVVLNGSPLPSGGHTAQLVAYTSARVAALHEDVHVTMLSAQSRPLLPEDYKEIENADVLLVAFPLYFDGIPSHLLGQLRVLEEHFNSRKGAKAAAKKHLLVFGLANCGFYEAENNSLALDMLKCWTERTGFIWGQGAGIGGGEILGDVDDITKAPYLKRVVAALNGLSSSIALLTPGKNVYAGPNMPRFLFVAAANQLKWLPQKKEEPLTKKQLLYRIP